MADPNIPHLAFPDNLGGIPLEVRVAMLERLVLEMAKHVDAASALPPEAALIIEGLKLRHPDV